MTDRNPNDAGDQFDALKEAFDGQVDIRPMLSRVMHRFGGPVGFADDLYLVFVEATGQTKARIALGILSLVEKCTDIDADDLPDDPAELRESMVAMLKEMTPDEREAVMQEIGTAS